MTCTCAPVHLNSGYVGGPRNWHPECAEHGVRSRWYADTRPLREARNRSLRRASKLAHWRRQTGWSSKAPT